jgi:hypothetical protein
MATTPGEVLADGWSLVIFPEGTRSPDGYVGRFQYGAAYLATQHQVPVVPIAHRGTFAAMPRGQGWPSPGRRRLTVRFGEPLRQGPTSRPATSHPASATRSPPCSTRSRARGGRPGVARRPAPPPTRPDRAPRSGAVCGSRPPRSPPPRLGPGGCGPTRRVPKNPVVASGVRRVRWQGRGAKAGWIPRRVTRTQPACVYRVAQQSGFFGGLLRSPA